MVEISRRNFGLEVKSWLGLNTYRHSGPLGQMKDVLCDFVHRGDHVARMGNNGPIPVAKVSSNYVLVQHRQVLDVAMQWIGDRFPRPDDLPADLWTDGFGRRIKLRVNLPFAQIDPGDGHLVMLSLQCINSVDRSTPLIIDLQWFRQVCSNGMFGWVTGNHYRAFHRCTNIVHKAEKFLRRRSKEMEIERNGFIRLLDTPVTQDQIRQWIQTTMVPAWGLRDAARLWRVCSEGMDGVAYARHPATLVQDVQVGRLTPVPGACAPANNLYHLGQAASWIAGTGGSMQQQISRTTHVWRLMSPLLEEL